MLKHVKSNYSAAIQSLSAMIEQRDPYTAGHQRRVAELAVKIATKMGLPPQQILGLRTASTLHDIGKLYVPSEIISKPAPLSQAEYAIIQEHPKLGWEVLKKIDFPWPVAEIVYQHHERLDGSGYPRGLKGHDILLETRILMVADAVDALSTDRPYRLAVDRLVALQKIIKEKGKLVDAQVVDACVQLF